MPTPIPARSRHPLAWRLVAAVTLALLGALLALAPARAASIIRYAAPGGATSGNCSSWANACTLAYALAVATSGDQVWVKAGVHKPTTGSDRGASFALKSGVAIYGGFAGNETALSQRDWVTNKTILSGDIDNNDTTDASGVVTSTTGITGTNSYHVVLASNVDNTAALDGFIITAGKADNQPFNATERGAGLYLANSSPTLRNLRLSGNHASGPGGAMYLTGSSPTLTNVTFAGNSAGSGGGIASEYASNPTLVNVVFAGNAATQGGGMFNYSSSHPTLTNVTFAGNSAGSGGGMFNWNNSSPTLVNVIMWGNTASNGPSIYNLSSAPTIASSLLQDSGCPSGASCGSGMIYNADPLFVDAANGNLRLKSGSPAIDAGNNSFVPASVTTDLDGNPRVIDGDNNGTATVDMGAYEAQPPIANAGPDQSVSVGQLVTLNGSGSSDPDNNLPLSYAWTQSGGPSVTLSGANTATPSFTPTVTGVYTFTLVVTDSTGLASAPDQVLVTVTPVRVYLPVIVRQP
jgi:predicted outer membrane repeat protein